MRNYFTRDRIIALALAGTAAPPLSQADRCAANAIRVIEATNRVRLRRQRNVNQPGLLWSREGPGVAPY